MSTTIHPSLAKAPNRLIVRTCAGCGAIERPGTCESGCSEQRLDLVPAADYDELVRARREAQPCIDAFRATVEGFLEGQPAGGYESAYRSVQYRARTVLHRFPKPSLDAQVLRGPVRPAATGWCPDCGGVDAPQQCLEFCIWRSVEWVTAASYREERTHAVSDWLIESRLRELLRRVASVTPLDGEWPRSWHALRAEALETLAASAPEPSLPGLAEERSHGVVATRAGAEGGTGLTPAAGERDAEQFRRARLEGMAWARAYATADEVRHLVESNDASSGADLTPDDPQWRGFLEGAEEVLDTELGG